MRIANVCTPLSASLEGWLRVFPRPSELICALPGALTASDVAGALRPKPSDNMNGIHAKHAVSIDQYQQVPVRM